MPRLGPSLAVPGWFLGHGSLNVRLELLPESSQLVPVLGPAGLAGLAGHGVGAAQQSLSQGGAGSPEIERAGLQLRTQGICFLATWMWSLLLPQKS